VGGTVRWQLTGGAIHHRAMARTLYAVRRPTGPRWDHTRGTRDQELWTEHAAFIDALFDAGRIILAGPFADASGALLIVDAPSAGAAGALFEDDPWTRADIMPVGEVKEWTIFLTGRLPD
jgi:hypothetical protein